MRTLLRVILILLLCVGSWYGYLVWQNNRNISEATDEDLAMALEKAIGWLETNRARILDDANTMLWWMVQQSASLTGNSRLDQLFSSYEQKYLRAANNPWKPLFNPNSWVPIRYGDIKQLPDYNQHYLYAITCDAELGEVSGIRVQFDPGFCAEHHPVSPACVTHQLIGMRLMQARDCGDRQEVQRTIAVLQGKVRRQLTWDTRVVDVYLQRVWVLIESGAADKVKPVWVRRVLEAQLPDGGWADAEPLINLPGDAQFGFTRTGVGIFSEQDSVFHATAQGVFLLGLLMRSQEP